MKKMKTSLLHSGLTLLLCVSMLIGSTFAWFSDGVSSSKNIITAGNLDLEMYWTDDLDSGRWYNVEDNGYNTIFSYDNWEPGYTDVKYIKLVNAGDLALNYKLALTPQNGVGKLAEVINVYFAEGGVAVEQRSDLRNLQAIGLLKSVLNGGSTADGTLLAADQYSPMHPSGEVVMTVAMNMLTTAGNDYMNEDAGTFSITAIATQASFEKDSFGSDYDSNAEYPAILQNSSVSAGVTPVNGKVPAGGVTMNGEKISAFVPEGVVLEDGVDKLTLTVTPLKNTTSDITIVNNEILIPVDVHIKGVDENNTVPIIIDLGEVLPKYLNMGNYRLFHVEDGINNEMTLVNDKTNLSAHNQYTYDSNTGAVSVAMASFSEVALLADTDNGWNGEYNYEWYGDGLAEEYTIVNADELAAFGKIVGGIDDWKDKADNFSGKTVTLLADINLADGEEYNNGEVKIFYPIGASNNRGEYIDRDNATDISDVSSGPNAFQGTFDGNGHTISNFYQNTWEMFGDYNDGYTGTPNYYKDAMGLFGAVWDAEIKNLTVDYFSSDGEFTPTGVIAAFAGGNSTFENIAITNCNPRVYNTGNGGIAGLNYNSTDVETGADNLVFKNITVDNTNTISALWGSYDVSCGGILGRLRDNSQHTNTENGTYNTVSFENCHVAAQMDVYNDVCGNYQYYQYRYSGSLIGTVDYLNETPRISKNYAIGDGKNQGEIVKASNTTVHYGSWNYYYYCEFVKNGNPSYCDKTQDFKYSRVDANADGTPVDGHTHTDPREDNHMICLPFNQLFTGYGWGASHVEVGDLAGVTILDRIQADSAEKFQTKFTGDFLYRVGNQNTVSVGNLFEEIPAEKLPVSVNDSGVWVTIEKIDDSMTVGGTFTKSTTENWEAGTIKFTGTGVVKITIQDYIYCIPTELIVEVVDATNVPQNGKIPNYGTTSVLLGNTSVSTLYLNGGATLYGNGFTIDCTNSPVNGTGNVSENYIIGLAGANLDNVKIVGKVYTEYGAMASNDYNRALVISTGNSTITNCYLSNTAAPIRINSGSLTVKDSTLKGGNFANIDVRSGHLTLDNVTTINQALGNDKAEDGSTVIGLGIVVYYEMVNTSATSITVKNGLTQHNNISSDDTFSNEYAKQFVTAMFGSSNSDLQYKNGNTTWVNTGIILMTSGINVEGAGNKKDVSFMSRTGAVYTVVPTSESIGATPAEDANSAQGVIAPSALLDHDNEAKGNYIPKEAGKNDYCYFDGEKVLISMDQGDTFQYDPFILNATKLGNELSYTVKFNGKLVEQDSKISFNAAGEYTITYTYEDPNNYRLDENGALETFTVTYTKTDVVSVAIVEPEAAHAEFTFVKESTATEEILYNNNTYISAKGVTADGTTWGKITVGDKTIFYPIVTANVNRNTTSKECQVFYYVFKNVLSITDANGTIYSHDQGTGTDGKMPSNLKVIKGNELKVENNVFTNYNDANLSRTAGKIFCYSSSSQEDTPEAFNGALAYKSPSGLSYNGSRNYDAAVIVQYQFTDSNNATYYYYVGYKISNPNNGKSGDGEDTSCITPDTLITLADGSQVRVDSLTGKEELLVWNLETGKYDTAPIVFVDSEQESAYEIIHLYFSDGSDVKVISEHGFFDLDIGKYVYIDAKNYANYVGHRFVKEGDVSEDTWNVITLDKVVVEKEVTTAWSPVTFEHLCYYTNGVLSMPGGIEGLFNIFEVDTDTMSYDKEQMQKDIETYGLFTFEDFNGLIPEIAFEAFNGDYLKVAIGKGLLTWEDIAALAERYIPLM